MVSFWPFSSYNQPPPKTPVLKPPEEKSSGALERLPDLKKQPELQDLSANSFILGCVTTGMTIAIYRRYGFHIKNATYITSDRLKKRPRIRGVVLRVGDGDGFRLFHTPVIGGRRPLNFRNPPKKPKAIYQQTINIRIAGADAPETGHFGGVPQPHGKESHEWLNHRLIGRTVYCELLSRDRHNRIVANVIIPRRFLPALIFGGHNVALEMLREGQATIYEQSGAQYGPEGKGVYLEAEAEAKEKRVGMWKNGTNIETPAEYKRKLAQGKSPTTDDPEAQEELEPPPSEKSWFRRKFFW